MCDGNDVDERTQLINAAKVSPRNVEFVAVSIVKFRRAKLVQDARLAKIEVEDIARAMAIMAGPKALADYDAGVSGDYLVKAEALLELAIKCAQERRWDD
jgi:hypothetical protein